jgi:hypothetical protein
MKKSAFLLFSIMLVLGLLVLPAGTARAAVGDNPVVTPVSGDMVFTTEIVPIAQLPGTVVLASQMLAPVGFPEGEAQFEGAGVRVTGMDNGKATACFTLPTIAVNQGWGGKVGVWNGTKWVLLPTAITTGTDEAANTTACAPISSSGIYAFIKWVVDPSLLPGKGDCDFEIIPAFYHFGGGGPENFSFQFYEPDFVVFSAVVLGPIAQGTPVYYKLLEYEGDVWGSFVGTVIHGAYGMPFSDFINLYVDLNDFEYAKLYVEYPSCWAILEYDQDTIFDD